MSTPLPPPIPDVYADSRYGYVPTRWVCNLFVILFAVSTAVHLGQALYTRTWFMLMTAFVAGILEIVGWSGRYWSSYSPNKLDPFLMQIVTTIIGPTPLLAANFVILGRMIRQLGTEYSRLGPRLYTIIFCSFDVASLIIQSVGGAAASAGAQDGNTEDTKRGGNVMLGGIVFQLFTITAYAILAAEFLIRYTHNRPIRARPQSQGQAGSTSTATINVKPTISRHMKIMTGALVFNSICLFIRAIYRTIELSDGWTGRIITTQVYFNVLDGAMITLAIYTLNFFHPGFLISGRSADKKTENTEMQSIL